MHNKRVLVAMSGGVDSSVTAYLLKSQGYECVGATMCLTCPAPDPVTGMSKVDRDIADAKAVAERLGIPHHVLDLQHVRFAQPSSLKSGSESLNSLLP